MSSIDTRDWFQVKLKTPAPGVSPSELWYCLNWCQQNIGIHQTSDIFIHDGWYYHGGGIFKFFRKEDAILFKLTWT